jgi:DNA-binding NarL/FixJ family response regulator
MAGGMTTMYKELTRAKQEVLVSLLQGDSYADIAVRLNKNEQTIRTTAARVFKHFDINGGTNGGGRHQLMSLFIDKKKLKREVDRLI